jgi:hypothetical protein
LTNGTTYRVRIKSLSVTDSAWVYATGTPGVPTAPTGLSVSPGNARLDLTWTAPSATGGFPITGYDVCRYRSKTPQICRSNSPHSGS